MATRPIEQFIAEARSEVETTDGQPKRIKLRRIPRFKRRVKLLTKQMIARGATVVTDGLSCLRGVADAGATHIVMATGSGRRAARHPAFKWVLDDYDAIVDAACAHLAAP